MTKRRLPQQMSIATKLLPGEFYAGGMYATARLSGYISTSHLLRAVRPKGGFGQHRRDQKQDRLELVVSNLFGLSVPALMQRHTTQPFCRAFPALEFGVKHGGEQRPRIVRRALTRELVPRPRVCADCAREDISYWGRSYFRCDHQLPGVQRCSKHQTALFETQRGDFDQFPFDAVRSQTLTVAPHVSIAAGNRVVQRYEQLACAVMERQAPISPADAHAAIKRRAREENLTLFNKGTRTTLSQFVAKQVPRAWLALTLGIEETRFDSRWVGPLDFVGRFACTTQSYLIALAALFDSADDAMHAVLHPEKLQSVDPPPRYYGGKFWDEGYGAEVYQRCRGEIAEIVRAIGGDRGAIRDSLWMAGYPTFSKSKRGPNLLAAMEAFARGESVTDVAATFDVSQVRLEDLLRVAVRRSLRTLTADGSPAERSCHVTSSDLAVARQTESDATQAAPESWPTKLE